MGFRLAELSTELVAPWGLAFLPDGRMLVTERAGRLKLLGADGRLETQVTGLPAVDARGQGGLLGIALDPAFSSNRRLYFSYAEADASQPEANGTAVARAVLSADGARLEQAVVIWRQLPKVVSNAHFGSRLVFDRAGALFVTLGDRLRDDERGFAQDLRRGNGKVVRITPDGAPAPGNPDWAQAGALPEIWSLGHRNVQGAALHPVTGELWVSEHGAEGGDEINRVLPGRNYGWPLASRSFEYETTTPVGAEILPGMEDPVWVWSREDGASWSGGPKSSIAPAGIAFYDAAAVPHWRGSLFVTALAGQALFRLTLDGNRVVAQERLLAERGERLRDVAQGPDGALYLLTDNGKLLRWGV
ncbi:MAG TPA: PQQ-dependent sugar dehydrogenase [Ramlibacter sp.]|nr:PQQ-dependent sugar dehydrogenase [Ramlibacter sp.]